MVRNRFNDLHQKDIARPHKTISRLLPLALSTNPNPSIILFTLVYKYQNATRVGFNLLPLLFFFLWATLILSHHIYRPPPIPQLLFFLNFILFSLILSFLLIYSSFLFLPVFSCGTRHGRNLTYVCTCVYRISRSTYLYISTYTLLQFSNKLQELIMTHLLMGMNIKLLYISRKRFTISFFSRFEHFLFRHFSFFYVSFKKKLYQKHIKGTKKKTDWLIDDNFEAECRLLTFCHEKTIAVIELETYSIKTK